LGRSLHRIGGWLFRAFALTVILPAAFLTASLIGALVPGGGGWDDQPAEVRIGLLRAPLHYDLLLPLDGALRADYAFTEGHLGLPVFHPAAEWLILGWGSEAFYTTAGSYSDIKGSAVWTAATGDRAVIRLDSTTRLPADLPQITWIWLSRAQYETLLAGLSDSFLRDQTRQPQAHPAPGLGQSDSFWRAKGRFSLFRPCNQWLSERLRAAGIPFGGWTPTPQSVALSLWWNARSES
jgi:uncharacterized protein (TIGR02117 family)